MNNAITYDKRRVRGKVCNPALLLHRLCSGDSRAAAFDDSTLVLKTHKRGAYSAYERQYYVYMLHMRTQKYRSRHRGSLNLQRITKSGRNRERRRALAGSRCR